jgi:imidazolonepropionase-like amidohydrolase
MRLQYLTLAAVIISIAGPVRAQSTDAEAVLFENVRIFDGTSAELSPPSNVLVVGNSIRTIASSPIEPDPGMATTVIDGDGRTLMPGLIDAHTHLMMSTIPITTLLTADIGFLNIAAAKAAEEMLLRGFTSVRDLGGPVFGLKRAIDAGLAVGPRIWPAGAFISQSGGHGDFRLPNEMPAAAGDAPYPQRIGASVIADSPDAVRQRAREQLALGASQIKLMAGGGSSSNYDPIDVTQYTVPELRAAVEAAENWGTYVTVHAYTSGSIRQAIEAGVKSIEHGQLVDEVTAKMMAEAGVWWSLQPFTLDDATSFAEGSPNWLKQQYVRQGTDAAYKLAKQYGIKTAWGTDVLFDPAKARDQGSFLAKMTRWYTPAEALKMATADNADLLALSGLRSPYQGRLGVVEEGALADLVLVDGDPLQDLDLVADPAKNFVVIMKDGKVYKNSIN